MDAVDPGSDGLTQWRGVSLTAVLDKFDVVAVEPGNTVLGTGPYLVVTERSVQLASPNIDVGLSLQELGYSSMSPWTAWTRQELNPKLRDKQGIRTYYDLKRQDGTIRGSLLQIKTPIRAAHWFISPASPSVRDKNIADFVEECLFDKLNVDWSQVLDDVLTMFEYGYSVIEKVYRFDGDRVVLQKLAPRHPLDIREWIFDRQGGTQGIVMEPSILAAGMFFPPGAMLEVEPFIPIRKLAIFSLEPEAGDLSGISVLRSAYKHWYYKDTLYKIDAIQKERHGIGVPVIILPPGFTADDKKLADELGRNLRTNDRAHIVIPSNWQIMFAKLEGQPVSAIESIDHHNGQIKINILAPFMDDSTPTKESTDIFYKSTRYLASSIANIFNKFVIRQLVDLNFSRTKKYPKLRARRIGEWEDLRTLSFAIRNFVGANLITPDDPLEEQIRQEADLPPMDKATQRQVSTPQSPQGVTDANVPQSPTPPKVGPPRQSPQPSIGQRGNQGRDGSGGK
jgi:hypothetical protein